MKRNPHARAAGEIPPTSDEALTTVDAAQGSRGQGATSQPNSPSAPHAGQALRVIDGERKAAAFLARLQAQQADPDELALIVSMLYGATLRGFARVIVKAIGGTR